MAGFGVVGFGLECGTLSRTLTGAPLAPVTFIGITNANVPSFGAWSMWLPKFSRMYTFRLANALLGNRETAYVKLGDESSWTFCRLRQKRNRSVSPLQYTVLPIRTDVP